MTDIPQAAIDAAEKAVEECHGDRVYDPRYIARAALTAALPHPTGWREVETADLPQAAIDAAKKAIAGATWQGQEENVARAAIAAALPHLTAWREVETADLGLLVQTETEATPRRSEMDARERAVEIVDNIDADWSWDSQIEDYSKAQEDAVTAIGSAILAVRADERRKVYAEVAAYHTEQRAENIEVRLVVASIHEHCAAHFSSLAGKKEG